MRKRTKEEWEQTAKDRFIEYSNWDDVIAVLDSDEKQAYKECKNGGQ